MAVRPMSASGTILAGGVIAAGLLLAGSAQAQAEFAAGRQVFRATANCGTCHGWAAHGLKDEQTAPDGPNLHETKLNREQMIEVVKCGRPGTAMPAFDRLAYTDKRCYDMTAAQIGADRPPPPPAVLTQRDIEAVVDFLQATVVGKPVSYDWCIGFVAGAAANACDQFKK
ncbi:MAG: c-type cytochrome [Alphaproteobacteria bacterium]|nr:c-type cytochrome [Alphaproteobacteria bacterium]